ncbi:tryptophan 2,3-dioxygenase family protein [Micromonospora sp. DT233]|uniref:tryptophan 2,3-dioxygenase family protein n=1 Tax=Micromonospora sp. DT233 TaxID=3393432 RepID=UPI003CF5E95E
MKRDHSPVLPGDGATDYARYMRLETLLDLQRRPEQVVHRDELLFQVVHQAAELWLKLATAELTEAAARLDADDPAAAVPLLDRATLGIRLVTDQLEMFRHLAPEDFQAMQPALGNGSGAESPGWRHVQSASRRLGRAFADHLTRQRIDLSALRARNPTEPLHRLAEAMVEWDERVALWRVRHYQVAIRIGGHGVAGTAGSPANVLVRLIDHRFFPELWRLRRNAAAATADVAAS